MICQYKKELIVWLLCLLSFLAFSVAKVYADPTVYAITEEELTELTTQTRRIIQEQETLKMNNKELLKSLETMKKLGSQQDWDYQELSKYCTQLENEVRLIKQTLNNERAERARESKFNRFWICALGVLSFIAIVFLTILLIIRK